MNDLFDYERDVKERIQLLNTYADPFDVVKRISGMYEFSGTRTLQEYLIYIVKTSTISSTIKADAVKSLFTFQEFKEIIREKEDSDHMKMIKSESNDAIDIRNELRTKKAYDALQTLCESFDSEIATPYKIDMIHMLMRNSDYFEDSVKTFCKIINDSTIDFDYRYKSILSIENNSSISDTKKFTVRFLTTFIENINNPTRYRILASQNLLQNFIISVTYRKEIETILINFAKDTELDYNVRADSCDTLINLGVEESIKAEANTILSTLGAMFGVVKTVYDNAQNVHHKDIEEASLPIIRFLLEIKDTMSYSSVISEIQTYLKEAADTFSQEQNEKIQLSLNRIAIDRSLYHNTSLTTILTKLWAYINNTNKKEELYKRLFEELEEMAGTCSSGFIMRLLNTLSGFEEGLSLKISYEEQIVANFVGRLNAYARRITDEDSPFYKEERLHDVKKLCFTEGGEEATDEDIVSNFRDNVLAEMTENTSNWSKRLNFSLFFRTHLSTLREELYDEFKSFVTDSEFDLSIRRAISTYEGVKFMA